MRAAAALSGPAADLRRLAVADSVAEHLSQAILTGEIEPGSFLREGELVGRYAVSRQSLRAALLKLQHEGMLRREMHRGFWVPRLTRAEVDDVYDMRVMVDTTAARRVSRAPERLSGAARVLDRIEQFKPTVSGPEIIRAHMDFHRAVVEAAGSPWLLRFYDLLFPATWLSLGKATWNTPMARAAVVVEYHRALLAELQSGDVERAVAAATQHSEAARPTAVGAVDGEALSQENGDATLTNSLQ
jgi:DNA-binding GntR family transcriptional regulator